MAESTAVLKTPGKVATPVSGGTGIVRNSATKSSVKGPTVVPTKGRGAAPKSALGR